MRELISVYCDRSVRAGRCIATAVTVCVFVLLLSCYMFRRNRHLQGAYPKTLLKRTTIHSCAINKQLCLLYSCYDCTETCRSSESRRIQRLHNCTIAQLFLLAQCLILRCLFLVRRIRAIWK